MKTRALTLALPAGNIESYAHRLNQIPMLTEVEEYALAKNFHENNDLESARTLVLAHMRFVIKIAKGYAGYGLALSDLIQEGSIGLMKAVKRFDPDYGVRLVSFAVHWIKAEIHEYIIKNWRIVKIATTKAQRKLFFNLRSAKNRLGWFTQEEIHSVAKDLGVKPEEVVAMEARLNNHDMAFDAHEDSEDDHALPLHAPAEYLEDHSTNPAHLLEHDNFQEKQQERLEFALVKLDERSREILQHRWLHDKKATLHELAAKYGISAERVRQLEAKALQQLKESIQR